MQLSTQKNVNDGETRVVWIPLVIAKGASTPPGAFEIAALQSHTHMEKILKETKQEAEAMEAASDARFADLRKNYAGSLWVCTFAGGICDHPEGYHFGNRRYSVRDGEIVDNLYGLITKHGKMLTTINGNILTTDPDFVFRVTAEEREAIDEFAEKRRKYVPGYQPKYTTSIIVGGAKPEPQDSKRDEWNHASIMTQALADVSDRISRIQSKPMQQAGNEPMWACYTDGQSACTTDFFAGMERFKVINGELCDVNVRGHRSPIGHGKMCVLFDGTILTTDHDFAFSVTPGQQMAIDSWVKQRRKIVPDYTPKYTVVGGAKSSHAESKVKEDAEPKPKPQLELFYICIPTGHAVPTIEYKLEGVMIHSIGRTLVAAHDHTQRFDKLFVHDDKVVTVDKDFDCEVAPKEALAIDRWVFQHRKHFGGNLFVPKYKIVPDKYFPNTFYGCYRNGSCAHGISGADHGGAGKLTLRDGQLWLEDKCVGNVFVHPNGHDLYTTDPYFGFKVTPEQAKKIDEWAATCRANGSIYRARYRVEREQVAEPKSETTLHYFSTDGSMFSPLADYPEHGFYTIKAGDKCILLIKDDIQIDVGPVYVSSGGGIFTIDLNFDCDVTKEQADAIRAWRGKATEPLQALPVHKLKVVDHALYVFFPNGYYTRAGVTKARQGDVVYRNHGDIVYCMNMITGSTFNEGRMAVGKDGVIFSTSKNFDFRVSAMQRKIIDDWRKAYSASMGGDVYEVAYKYDQQGFAVYNSNGDFEARTEWWTNVNLCLIRVGDKLRLKDDSTGLCPGEYDVFVLSGGAVATVDPYFDYEVDVREEMGIKAMLEKREKRGLAKLETRFRRKE